jgi:hypothetical protein
MTLSVVDFPSQIENISDLLKFLSESKDKATVDKLLGPILDRAFEFYHRFDEEQQMTPADPALAIATYIVDGMIEGKMDETRVKAILASMAYLAVGFVLHRWDHTPLSRALHERLLMIVAAGYGVSRDAVDTEVC